MDAASVRHRAVQNIGEREIDLVWRDSGGAVICQSCGRSRSFFLCFSVRELDFAEMDVLSGKMDGTSGSKKPLHTS